MVIAPTTRRATTRGRSREQLPAAALGVFQPRDAPRPPAQPLELESISSQWQVALDAAQRGLSAAARSLPVAELARRRARLDDERLETAQALGRLARVSCVHPSPWLSIVPVTNKTLGLPATVTACVFDLEGVLTDSGLLHAWAWGEVLDAFLLQVSERAHWQFRPFDRGFDYRTYIEGRPRLEGVRAFLDSRGIRLPEGRFDDAPDANTACGLARRKGELLGWRLRQRGSTALPGARRYLQAAGHAGLDRCVVSASSNTARMLEDAGLAALVAHRVDAASIGAEGLRSRPAPDLLLTACRLLEVSPNEAVTFTHSAAGVVAGLSAGLAVIGIGAGAQAELLRGAGAERVHPSLSVLLDSRLPEG